MTSHLVIARNHSKFVNLLWKLGKAIIQALAFGEEQLRILALSKMLADSECLFALKALILEDSSFWLLNSDIVFK